jgi:hypothetical protein
MNTLPTTTAKEAIRSILEVLNTDSNVLCTRKDSGVHYFQEDNIYRVHKSDIVPRFLNNKDTNKLLGLIVNQYFSSTMYWDRLTLWLTIYK